MKGNSIIELAKALPGLQVTITAKELVEVGYVFMREAKELAEKEAREQSRRGLMCKESVMAYLDISERTLNRYDKNGVLPSVMVGGVRRWKRDDVENAICRK